jgi:hypothetical protein
VIAVVVLITGGKPVRLRTVPSTVVVIIKLALGIAMIVFAAVQWRRRNIRGGDERCDARPGTRYGMRPAADRIRPEGFSRGVVVEEVSPLFQQFWAWPGKRGRAYAAWVSIGGRGAQPPWPRS